MVSYDQKKSARVCCCVLCLLFVFVFWFYCHADAQVGTLQELVTGVGPPPPVPPEERYVLVSFARDRWIRFLRDGSTTRQDVITSLGEPTERYAGGRIFAYRLLLVEDDRQELGKWTWRKWSPTEASINKRRENLAKKENLLVYRKEMKETFVLELIAREAEYSLVIVFDDQGIVRNNSLLRILP